jgi:YVTN family beta-propeller protein
MSDLIRIERGAEVGGYRIDQLIGRGGMGEVYRARDERLGRNVALKILPSRLAEDDAFRERLVRESRLAASLDHPNVVPVYDAGEEDGHLYLAMRFVDGTDLKALLRREGALSPERAIAITAQIADALDAAHARGLVHRDVKPSNVLLDQQGGREHAYLADFGLTQSVSDGRPTEGHLIGTVDYVAPEQVRGEDVDGRADVYALGCLLFETLTGTLPFSGASDIAVIYAHLEQEPPSASERAPGLSSAVDDVLARAMAKDRDGRQASCRELVDETRAALGLESRVASRRRLLASGAVLATMLAVAIVAAAVLLRGGNEAAEPTGGIVRIDAVSGEPGDRIRLGAYPVALAAGGGVVWAASTREGALWKVNAGSGAAQHVAANGSPRDIAIRGGRVYVTSDGADPFTRFVSQYDLVSGFRHGSVKVLACSIAAGRMGVWVAGCPNVVELETGGETLRLGRTVQIPYLPNATAATWRICLCGMATGLGSVWVIGDWSDPRLWRIDPRSATVRAVFALPFKPHALTAGAGGIWVADFIGDRVVRLDPRTGSVRASVPVGRGPVAIDTGPDAVWTANRLDGSVSRIDPASLEVTDTIEVGPRPVDVDADGDEVWVALEGEST